MAADDLRTAEPALTILHVSDLQFGKHHRFADDAGGFDTLLRRLCDDLDVLKDSHGLAPQLVALTGDLAEWGMKAELDQVLRFCEGLEKHLGLARERVLVIPGNHDVNRKKCLAYFAACEGDDVEPQRPYWPKWGPYVELFGTLYRDVERYRFTQLEPTTTAGSASRSCAGSTTSCAGTSATAGCGSGWSTTTRSGGPRTTTRTSATPTTCASGWARACTCSCTATPTRAASS
jgi:hypothetical protein